MNNSKAIILIFVLALLLRLSYVIFIPQLEGEELKDARDYDALAWSFATGDGYHHPGYLYYDVKRSPLFPLFLAGLYSLFGHNLFFVKIVQVVIGAFTCLLIYLIAKKVFGEKIAFLSGLLAAFYPAFISYTGLVLTETLATFLLSASLYSVMKATESKNRWRRYVLAGIILGLLSLCRSEMLLFPFFLLLPLLLIYKRKKQAVKGFLILSCLAALTISPWTVRNYILFHKFIPVAVGLGQTLWFGSSPGDWNYCHYDREPVKSLLESIEPTDNLQIEFNTKLKKIAFKNITTHPFIYSKLCIKKFFRFWVTSHTDSFRGLRESFISVIQNRKFNILFQKSIFLAINMGIILLGFFGIFVAHRQWKMTSLLLAPILYKVLVHTLLYSAPRYQIPIMAFMLVFSAVGIQHLRYFRRCGNAKA